MSWGVPGGGVVIKEPKKCHGIIWMAPYDGIHQKNPFHQIWFFFWGKNFFSGEPIVEQSTRLINASFAVHWM